jgi:hypothetical protein
MLCEQHSFGVSERMIIDKDSLHLKNPKLAGGTQWIFKER